MSLDSMIEAMRAEADGDEAELAAATQLRVRRSLESRACGRQRLIGLAAMFAILFVGTVSWALATGQVEALWRPAKSLFAPEPEPAVPPPQQPPQQQPRAQPKQSIATPPVPAEPVAPVPAEPVAPVAPPIAPTAPARVPSVRIAPPAEPAPVEALYRRAHELHFHGGDPAATLAAWDAYLAAEPDGRFAVEARYNRALTLIRIGRYAEARAALAPFARGELAGGYRQAEAEQLVARLARVR